MKAIKCFKCKQENEPDSEYCSNCGSYIEQEKLEVHRYDIKPKEMIRCPSCGAEGEENFKEGVTVIGKRATLVSSTNIMEKKTCRKCGYTLVRKERGLV